MDKASECGLYLKILWKSIDVKKVFFVFYFSHVFLTFFIFANVFYYRKRYEFQAVSSKWKQGHTLNLKKMWICVLKFMPVLLLFILFHSRFA
jgi:hypothetical protein